MIPQSKQISYFLSQSHLFFSLMKKSSFLINKSLYDKLVYLSIYILILVLFDKYKVFNFLESIRSTLEQFLFNKSLVHWPWYILLLYKVQSHPGIIYSGCGHRLYNRGAWKVVAAFGGAILHWTSADYVL